MNIISIDWGADGWWLASLLCFHVGILTVVISIKSAFKSLLVVGSVLITLLLSTSQLNSFLIEFQNFFSSKQYFDEDGLFLTLVFAIPLFLPASLIVLFLFKILNRRFIHASKQKKLKAKTH